MNAALMPAAPGRDQAGAPQLRTLLLTDLCDSTQLVERLGDGPAAELFRQHDLLVLQLQQQWRGRLIDRSDGLLLLFERPLDGLGFALDYARGLRELGRELKIDLKARAGLHVGEVLTWRNSDEAVKVGAKPLEVEGLAKPMAARLMTLARPGQILVSAVAEPLAHRSARELGERGQHLLWKSHGRWRFKGVPAPQQIFEVGEPGIAPLRAPQPSPKARRDTPLWRRPAALAAELLLVAGIGLGIWLVTRPQPAIAFNQRDWVVVADLRNLTGQPVLDDSLEQAFRISLEQSRYVNVLSDLKARQTLERMRLPPGTELDRAIASEIAIRDGARAVILPTVAEVGGHVRVSAEVIDPHSQTTVYSQYADGRGVQSALASIDDVTAGLREKLGEAMESIEKDSAPLPEVTTENLDALRAYALGQQATAEHRWEEAKALYLRAVELDPNFALAYMGLVRLHWSSIDYSRARPYLEKAIRLSVSLPERDRLYLEAWKAETANIGTPLEEWKLLASMYPDYFAGASNASWYLLAASRFKEALPYATAAAVPQDPLRAFPIQHIGRIHLALGDPAEALRQFRRAENLLGGKPSRYSADALAVMGRYEEAQQILDHLKPRKEEPSSFYGRMNRISLALDRDRLDEAIGLATGAVTATESLGQPHKNNFVLIKQSAALAKSPSTVSIDELAKVVRSSSLRMRDNTLSTHQGDAFRLLMAVYLAQRSGHDDFANKVLPDVAKTIASLQSSQTAQMLVIVKAGQLRSSGSIDAAIALLEQQLTGHELLQTHVALLEAYKAANRGSFAHKQAKWLAAHMGLAYAEQGYSQLLQPLNVRDVRVTTLSLNKD